MTSATSAVVWSPNSSARRSQVSWLCVHWTGGTFAAAVDWCLRDESDVSYHLIISRTGERRQVVPWERAAWAVGFARSPDVRIAFGYNSNHSSESIALAGSPPIKPTAVQVEAMVDVLAERMKAHGWGPPQVWRILAHSAVAIFGPDSPKAGQLGRKDDPDGQRWLDVVGLRARVAQRLEGQ